MGTALDGDTNRTARRNSGCRSEEGRKGKRAVHNGP
jgi:hypothetical protein